MIRVLYFSWLKERVGTGAEDIAAGSAQTARDLANALAQQSDGHAAAFENLAVIKVAIDQEMADLDAPISGAREVAFFPPVTGG